MKYTLIILSIFHNLFMCVSDAQEMSIKHFTERDGLPSATVYNILQDRQGFMWMSTPAGVSRFDGKKFAKFSMNDGLAENEVMKVAQDAKGRIWFLGFNGTLSYYYNGKFFNHTNDTILKKTRIPSSYLYFFEDTRHRLWFSFQNGHTVLDGNKVSFVHQTGRVSNGRNGDVHIISGSKIYTVRSLLDTNYKVTEVPHSVQKDCILSLHDDTVLVAANEGFVRQTGTEQDLIKYYSKELTGIHVQNLNLDSHRRLWVGTGGKGIYCYNYSDFTGPVKHYLDGTHTTRSIEDTEGNIWIGTVNNGLYCLQPWEGIKATYNSCTGLEGDQAFSVVKDHNGIIYGGLGKGNIAIIQNGQVRNVTINRINPDYNPLSRALATGKYIFWGGDKGVIRMNVPDGQICPSVFYNNARRYKYQPAVKDLCLYKNGVAVCESYWLSTDTALLTSACGKTRFEHIDNQTIRKYAIYADNKGILWFSDVNGLNSYYNKEIVTYAVVSTHISESIRSIAETDDSSLVLATYGQGVFFFKNNTIVASFTERNGLANNICKRVFVHRDNVYVATISGVTAFKYKNCGISSVRTYNTSYGLAADNVNDVYADDSDICIATSGGITVINEQAASRPVPAPPLYITAIRSHDSTLNPTVEYKLHYTQDAIHFDYIGISYKSADNVRYAYRLGKQQPWTQTKNTSVDLPYLPPGNYRFEIKARIGNGPWGAPKYFAFTIAPPFWATNWFRAICLLSILTMAIGTGFYIVGRQNRKRNKQLEIENQIATLEQQALQAMMNPHFVFNVMNSIQHFINNNNRHEANLYLSDFARLIRMNMDISSRRLISLDEEIGYLQLYLSMERLRFGDRLVYAINIDEDIDTDETMIPVMMLQPFLENALLHGILPLKGTGHLTIDIRKQGEQLLRITITDDGVGMGTETKTKTHESKGMRMTQQRLTLLAKLSGKALHIKTDAANPRAENKGTKVEILLPADLS